MHLTTSFSSIFLSGTLALVCALGASSTQAAQDGSLLSQTPTGAAGINTAATQSSDQTIYFGSQISNPGKSAFLYSLTSGIVAPFFQAEDDIAAPPAFGADGTVYFGSWSGKFYAVDKTGNRLWDFSVNGFLAAAATIASDGTIYFGGSDGRLHALSANGSEKWYYQTGDWIKSSPVVGNDGTVYVGSWDGYLYAFSSAGGLKWKYSMGDAIVAAPILDANGTIYCAARNGQIAALKTTNGSKLWTATVEMTEAGPALSPSGGLIIGSTSGMLYNFDHTSGSQVWTALTGGAIYSAVVIRSDNSIIVSSGTKVQCYTSDGSARWSFSADSKIGGTALVTATGQLAFGSQSGLLYILNGNGATMVSAVQQTTNTNTPASTNSSSGATSTQTAASASSSPSNVALVSPVTPVSTATVTTSSSVQSTATSNTIATTVPTQLPNVSCRGRVGPGDDALIEGFIIAGSTSRTLLIRAVGPTLQQFGVNEVLSHPKLTIYSGTTALKENSQWDQDDAANLSSAASKAGTFELPAKSLDAALLVTLAPGNYTITVTTMDGTNGLVLLETYQLAN